MSGILTMLGLTLFAWIVLAFDIKNYNRRLKDHEKRKD